MLHVVSSIGFLVVAVSAAGLIWHLLAERADAIVAALRMAEPVPALPESARRIRIRVRAEPLRPVSATARRVA